MNTPSRPSGRAIVLGASIAGLLAARVLRERFAQVVLLERDELPDAAAPRKGTPHAVHPHGLLARGREVLEELFPGMAEALLARGGVRGDIGSEIAIEADGQRLALHPLGVDGIAVSRLAIEAEMRNRVRAIEGITLMSGVEVLEPECRSGRVCGARYRAATIDASPQVMAADLVVDCTGRASRTPQWLQAWGFDAPTEERVIVDLAYTSAYFNRDALHRPTLAAIIGITTPARPRPSILLAQEPDAEGRARWVVGVGGYAGDHVDLTHEAMAERAHAIDSAEIASLVEQGEPIGPVMRYLFRHSQRRRYEKLTRFPTGYLVMGDALASFNPVYGQGMTVAACQALALRDALSGSLQEMPRRFLRAAARVIDTPWQLAVGGDLALPAIEGPRPFPLRWINAYVARVQRAAVSDASVASAFVRVMHMLAAPSSLFAPAVLWRVLRYRKPPERPAAASWPNVNT